jgi:hypothetical protein
MLAGGGCIEHGGQGSLVVMLVSAAWLLLRGPALLAAHMRPSTNQQGLLPAAVAERF